MQNYTQWNYSNLNDDTKMGIYHLFKDSDSAQIKQFLNWLDETQSSFMFSHRDFIFSRLIEFNHYNLSDEFMAIKPYQFDEKIANTIIFHQAISFTEDAFNYLADKIDLLDIYKKTSIYKNFWSEFLTFQFQRNEEVDNNLKNLSATFKRIPFYGNKEIEYGFYTRSREEFLTKQIFKLTPYNQEKILQSIGLECAQYQPDSTKTFYAEFEKYPEAIKGFELFNFNKKLNNSLTEKNSIKNIKI